MSDLVASTGETADYRDWKSVLEHLFFSSYVLKSVLKLGYKTSAIVTIP